MGRGQEDKSKEEDIMNNRMEGTVSLKAEGNKKRWVRQWKNRMGGGWRRKTRGKTNEERKREKK